MTNEKTYPYEIAGRLIALRLPSESQLAVAIKILDSAKKELRVQDRLDEKDRNATKTMEYVGRLLKIIDMMIISEEDREYVEDAMINDEVQLNDLVSLMASFGTLEEPAPTKGPVKKARRAS